MYCKHVNKLHTLHCTPEGCTWDGECNPSFAHDLWWYQCLLLLVQCVAVRCCGCQCYEYCYCKPASSQLTNESIYPLWAASATTSMHDNFVQSSQEKKIRGRRQEFRCHCCHFVAVMCWERKKFVVVVVWTRAPVCSMYVHQRRNKRSSRDRQRNFLARWLLKLNKCK